ncbi:outer membrane beta-barrel protein [Mucilaginibacter sp. AW1-3]
MKDRELHLMLCQKRDQLRISDDAQHDWLDMQAMLDMHMPIPAPTTGNPAAGNGGTAGAAGMSGIKLFSILLVTLGVAALTYFAIKTIATKSRTEQKTIKTIKDSNSNAQSKAVNLSQADADSLDASQAAADLNNSNTVTSSPNKTQTAPSAKAKNNYNTVTNTGNSEPVNSTAKTGHTALVDNNTTINRTQNGTASNKIKPVVPGNHTTAAGSGSPVFNGNVVNTHGSSVNNNTIKKTGPGLLSSKISGRGVVPPARLSSRTGGGAGLHNRAGTSALHNNNTAARHGRGRTVYPGTLAANNTLRTNQTSQKGRNIPSGKRDQRDKTGTEQHTDPTAPVLGAGGNTTVKNSNGENTVLTEAIRANLKAEQYQAPALPSSLTDKFKDEPGNTPPAKNANNKAASGSKNSKVDWGILAGVNSSGSFTGKSQNANFYGSFPVDLYFGLFATYNFSNKWGVNLSIRGLNPQNVSGTYSHKNESKKDTLQTLDMSDSRKLYFIDVPLNLVFRPAAGISIKAGPVFSLPVKQANGVSTFQTGKLKKDSAYYAGVIQTINATNYTQSLSMGLSGGVSFETGRFIFDAAYVTSLKGVTVGSSLGSYTTNGSSFLFSVGFKLNKAKK